MCQAWGATGGVLGPSHPFSGMNRDGDTPAPRGHSSRGQEAQCQGLGSCWL